MIWCLPTWSAGLSLTGLQCSDVAVRRMKENEEKRRNSILINKRIISLAFSILMIMLIVPLSVSANSTCPLCSGSGVEWVSATEMRSNFDGYGTEYKWVSGYVWTSYSKCGGTGKKQAEKTCTLCSGTGTVSDFIVNYNADGGSGKLSSQIKDQAEALYLSNSIPNRNGYEFKGWATAACRDLVYTSGNAYIQNTDITLYAVWPPIYTGCNGVGLS